VNRPDIPPLPDHPRVLVVIPTYNEYENVRLILDRLRAAVPTASALVVDDASPDGTGAVADEIAADDERVHVLHRAASRGSAPPTSPDSHWGLEQGFDVLVEMDADGSHAPEELPRLLSALDHADLVIGSRYIAGGSVVNWPMRREVLSRGANFYSRIALGAPIHDITAGFRAYRAEVLRTLKLDGIASQGYCFQIDLAWRTYRSGFRIAEVPITFTERAIGSSKMSRDVVRESLFRVTAWGASHRWGPGHRGVPPGVPRADRSRAGSTQWAAFLARGGRSQTANPRHPRRSAPRTSGANLGTWRGSTGIRQDAVRRAFNSASRSFRISSSSSIERRSSSMSQWVRGGFAAFASGTEPSTNADSRPCIRQSHTVGASASSASGTVNSWSRGHR
jgi:dolichol-phosphate mannosyltransferase